MKKESSFTRIERITRQLPAAPAGVRDWILRECVKATYLIYSKTRNIAVCTRCGKTTEVKQLPGKIAHNEPIMCPRCGRSATLKSENIKRDGVSEYFRVMIITKKAQNVFVSVSEVVVKFEIMGQPVVYRDIRQIIKLGKKERVNLFRRLPWCFGGSRWEERKTVKAYHATSGNFAASKFEEIRLYERNIDDKLFAKTDLNYAIVPELLESLELTPEELVKYMDMFLRYPATELLVKFGITLPVLNYIDDHGPKNAVHWKGNSIQKMLHCTMPEAREIREKEVGLWTLDTLNYYRKQGQKIGIGAAELLADDRRINRKLPEDAATIAVYLAAQNETYGRNNTMRDYEDYKCDCKKICYSWTRKRNRFPINFYETHMEVAEKARTEEEQIYAEAITAVHEKYRWVTYENDSLLVRVAKTPEEIRKEGSDQGHCVARYAKDVAEGRCIIAFIREKDKPNKAYYTVELSPELTVRQCRGLKNCNATSDVKEFVEHWMKYIQKEWKKRKRQKPIQEKKSA